MNPEEARIARIAYWLGRENVLVGKDPTTTINNFVTHYIPERPCAYMMECVNTGRCPREVACDN